MDNQKNAGVMGASLTPGVSDEASRKWKERQAILEKSWDECTPEEKLEKVREELVQLSYNTTAIHNVSQDVQRLKEHTHADGKVVIPLNSNTLSGIGSLGGLASRRNNLQ